MVIFDTNAILRYILQDNVSMADAVEVVLCAARTYASTKLDFIDCLLVGYAKSEKYTIIDKF